VFNDDGTVSIFLTRNYIALVDVIDADLAKFRWTSSITQAGKAYPRRSIKTEKKIYRTVAMHRIILERILDRELSEGEFCDHKNGNTLDNRRSNLRIASKADNNRNMRITDRNKSGYKGVYKHQLTERWVARISVNNKSIYLGIFKSPEEAHGAYCKAAVKYFGEFARFE
jgi:hypothetical protein